ncbi:MAG: NADH-quinone oxidoreductase subunit C [Marinilabiliales bacterium]|nr:NADH-quinone oxidoreductase subunit C [Marinilabiliales bacterium]
MDISSIQDQLIARFPNQPPVVDSTGDLLTLTVNKEVILETIKFLKEELGFDFLTDLTGIHYPDRELPLGVIYHLHNFRTNARIRVKAFLAINTPEIESMTSLFAAANWMERETYDFFGIQFINHPKLERILNVEYLDYFPLRKEYPLEDQTREDKDDRFFGR